jgi:hypothetical protein
VNSSKRTSSKTSEGCDEQAFDMHHASTGKTPTTRFTPKNLHTISNAQAAKPWKDGMNRIMSCNMQVRIRPQQHACMIWLQQGVTRGYKDGLQPETLADGNWLLKQNQPVSKIETKSDTNLRSLFESWFRNALISKSVILWWQAKQHTCKDLTAATCSFCSPTPTPGVVQRAGS